MKRGLVLGFFDGVHIAHQAVIKSALDYAGEAMLITFKEAPSKYFNQKAEYIYSRQQSLQKIKSLGVSEVIELDFAEIANMPADDYLKFIVQKYNPVSISTGYNHTFGKNKSGNPEFLNENAKKYGYKYICTPPQKLDGEIVSSTLIRKMLREGKINEANRALGSNFLLSGNVIKGAQLGRTIGFPTANMIYPEEIVKIPFGVYGGRITNNSLAPCGRGVRGEGETCPIILNWGMKPTVHNTKEPVLETHIINFNGDLYGKELEIEITSKIRDEQKFDSLEELKKQIAKDVEECLKL